MVFGNGLVEEVVDHFVPYFVERAVEDPHRCQVEGEDESDDDRNDPNAPELELPSVDDKGLGP